VERTSTNPSNPTQSAAPNAAPNDGYTIDPARDYFTTDATASNSKRAALIMLMVGGVAFGSFLWLRMRLVSDMPRQAYAEPDSAQMTTQQPPQQPQPLDDSTKVMDLNGLDADASPDAVKPYSVNDASGGMN
jgi:hypothetical protein